jgi:16S rRNA (uracil1498-N3)-methyltransferase
VRRFAANHVPAVGEFVHLDADVSHHLLRVTGIAPGERVELFDGSGVTAVAELCSVEHGMAQLRVLEHGSTVRGTNSLHLMIAQLRANALDTVLRMATELGVTDVTVIQADRCVARGDKRERWNRVVQSAAGQSGRSSWPTIHPPSDLSSVLELPAGTVGWICVPTTVEVCSTVVSTQRLLIGPEGGWTEDEVLCATEKGWRSMGLGSTVLRADTAAVAAIVRCSF